MDTLEEPSLVPQWKRGGPGFAKGDASAAPKRPGGVFGGPLRSPGDDSRSTRYGPAVDELEPLSFRSGNSATSDRGWKLDNGPDGGGFGRLAPPAPRSAYTSASRGPDDSARGYHPAMPYQPTTPPQMPRYASDRPASAGLGLAPSGVRGSDGAPPRAAAPDQPMPYSSAARSHGDPFADSYDIQLRGGANGLAAGAPGLGAAANGGGLRGGHYAAPAAAASANGAPGGANGPTFHSSDFPTLKEPEPQRMGPAVSPYNEDYLSTRTKGNWSSKLLDEPLPKPAGAGEADGGGGGSAAATTAAAAAPAAAPVKSGWSAVAATASTAGGGVGGATAKATAAEKARLEQLAAKKTKQLIPVLARPGSNRATAAAALLGPSGGAAPRPASALGAASKLDAGGGGKLVLGVPKTLGSLRPADAGGGGGGGGEKLIVSAASTKLVLSGPLNRPMKPAVPAAPATPAAVADNGDADAAAAAQRSSSPSSGASSGGAAAAAAAAAAPPAAAEQPKAPAIAAARAGSLAPATPAMIDVVGAGSGAMLTPPGFGDMPLLAAAAAAEAPVETGSRISVFESLRKGRSLSAEQTVVPSGMPPPGFGGVAPGGGSYSDQAAAGGAPVLGSGGWGSAASQDASFAAAAATLQQYFSRSSSPAVAAFSDQPGFLSSYAPAAAAWPQQPSPSLYDPSSGVPAQLQPAALGGSYLAVPGQYGAAAVAVPGGAAATAAVSAADEPISSKADLELAQKLQVLDDDEAFLRSLGWCEASGSV